MLHHARILGDPQQTRQNQSGIKRGQKSYITPAFLGIPNKRHKIKAGPKDGGKCYITPAFSGVPNKRDKIRVYRKEGQNTTSPLHSRESLTKGTK